MLSAALFSYFTCSFAISLTRHLFIGTQCTHAMSLLYYTMHSGLFPESLHTAQTVSPEVLKWAFTYVEGINSNWLHAIYTDKHPSKICILNIELFLQCHQLSMHSALPLHYTMHSALSLQFYTMHSALYLHHYTMDSALSIQHYTMDSAFPPHHYTVHLTLSLHYYTMPSALPPLTLHNSLCLSLSTLLTALSPVSINFT